MYIPTSWKHENCDARRCLSQSVIILRHYDGRGSGCYIKFLQLRKCGLHACSIECILTVLHFGSVAIVKIISMYNAPGCMKDGRNSGYVTVNQ